MADDLSIIIGGTSLSGWEEIHLVRSCERVPSAFDITATEKFPGQFQDVWIEAGAACQIKIGADLILTGYVDRAIRSLSARQHVVRVQGRSKVGDLIDCSITGKVLNGMQVASADLVTLATNICKPFGIGVRTIDAGQKYPFSPGNLQTLTFAASLGQHAFEIIEEAARYAQVMAYDDEAGNLVFAAVGASRMASGFAQGVNVQSAQGTLSMDQRYSEYLPHLMSYEAFNSGVGSGSTPLQPVYDKGVPRYRPLNIISEQFSIQGSLANQRAQWEKARRYGRSQAIRLVCDSWRDSAGKLWQPNAYAQVYLPGLKCAPKDPWIISDVTFNRDAADGTTAELLLMPKDAYAIEPIFLQPFAWGNDDGNSAPASKNRPTPDQVDINNAQPGGAALA